MRMLILAFGLGILGCGGGNDGPVKPQDDPAILKQAEDSMNKAGASEGPSTPVKTPKKK